MHARFLAALAQLPADLQAALRPVLGRDDFAAVITAAEAERITAASGLDADALALALLPLAAACAQTPISCFNVGAVAQGASGNLYFGANMEFAAIPLQQTVHAEQSAVTHAWLRDERALRSVTVNYTPCGHCRQFMNELNSAPGLAIRLPGRQTLPLGHYLPDAFGPRDLNITTLLMDDAHHGLSCADEDALTLAALAAANRSHAPYSQAFSGVALQTASGAIYTGRYAENAAFNPSLPPLQAALNLLNLAGEPFGAVRRAVLAEREQAALSQWDATRSLLNALGCADVHRVALR